MRIPEKTMRSLFGVGDNDSDDHDNNRDHSMQFGANYNDDNNYDNDDGDDDESDDDDDETLVITQCSLVLHLPKVHWDANSPPRQFLELYLQNFAARGNHFVFGPILFS